MAAGDDAISGFRIGEDLRDRLEGSIPGFFNRLSGISSNSGGSGAPQTQAANAIQAGLDTASGTIEEGIGTARGDLQPFTAAGIAGLAGIAPLLTDPTAQADFVKDNPFFDMLAEDAQRRIFNSGSATGKRFAGGTAEALRNSILLLGPDLINQNVNQRLDLANLGLTAAGGQATSSTQGALTLADLAARGGETQAAGILGLENTRRQDKALRRSDRNNLLTTGIGALVSLSDRRLKTDIHYQGEYGGVPWYLFKYIGSDRVHFGTMAQEVEHIPNAVIERNGVKYVNYEAL